MKPCFALVFAFCLFMAAAPGRASDAIAPFAPRPVPQAEIESFIQAHPYPCPQAETRETLKLCLLDAFVTYSNEGKEQTESWSTSLLVEMIARHGTIAQKKSILHKYEENNKNWLDSLSANNPKGKAATGMPQEMHRTLTDTPIKTIQLLLSMGRMDDAVNLIQQLSDAKIEIILSPQALALGFLVNAGQLDDAVIFFERTQHILFKYEHAHVHSQFSRISTTSNLIGALLAQGKEVSALSLRKAIDKDGIFYKGLEKDDDYNKYFPLYEEYKNSPDKESFARKYWGKGYDGVLGLANDKKKREAPIKNVTDALSKGDMQEIQQALEHFRKSVTPGSRRPEISRLLPYIQDIKTTEGRSLLWEMYIRYHFEEYAQRAQDSFASMLIINFAKEPSPVSLAEKSFYIERFLTEKLLRDIQAAPASK